MRWQDIALMLCSFLFTVALVPALRSPAKPSFSTSLLTAALLVVSTTVFSTLHLWLTAISTGCNCLAWSTLAWQTRRRKCIHDWQPIPIDDCTIDAWCPDCEASWGEEPDHENEKRKIRRVR